MGKIYIKRMSQVIEDAAQELYDLKNKPVSNVEQVKVENIQKIADWLAKNFSFSGRNLSHDMQVIGTLQNLKMIDKEKWTMLQALNEANLIRSIMEDIVRYPEGVKSIAPEKISEMQEFCLEFTKNYYEDY